MDLVVLWLTKSYHLIPNLSEAPQTSCNELYIVFSKAILENTREL